MGKLTGIEAAAASAAELSAGVGEGKLTGIDAAACKAVTLGAAGAGAAVACTGLEGGNGAAGAALIGDGAMVGPLDVAKPC